MTRAARRLSVAALGLLLLASPALAGATSEQANAKRSTVDAKWVLLHVGARAKSVRLVYLAACGDLPDGRAQVTETGEEVRIRVQQTRLTIFDCQYVQLLPRLTVRLKSPIGGRRIVGQTFDSDLAGLKWRTRLRAGRLLPVVPGVTGLSPTEAARVLRRQTFRVRVVRRRPKAKRPVVVAQRPKANRVLTDRRARVTLITR